MKRHLFVQWLDVWDGSTQGFESCPFPVSDLSAAEASALCNHLTRYARHEAARCILAAATLTLPPKQRKVAFQPAQMMALEGLRLWLGVTYRDVISTVKGDSSLVALLFPDGRLPDTSAFFGFGRRLTKTQWREFTYHLRSFNPILAEFYTT